MTMVCLFLWLEQYFWEKNASKGRKTLGWKSIFQPSVFEKNFFSEVGYKLYTILKSAKSYNSTLSFSPIGLYLLWKKIEKVVKNPGLKIWKNKFS